MQIRAAVLESNRQIKVKQLSLPKEIPAGWALMRVEGNGICGSDYAIWSGELAGRLSPPLVMGHEMVGTMEHVPAELAACWRVSTGDRVALEPFVRCGGCIECLTGRANFCRNRFVYGSAPLAREPGITGGLAEYVAVHPRSNVYRVSPEVTIEDAVLFNPIGNGFEWALRNGQVEVGDRVLVLGAGQRGLASVIAANEAGAAQIIVTGLAVDEPKLELAKRFGASDVIVVDREDTVESVQAITGGEGVDVTLDLVPRSTESVRDAIAVTRPEGIIVLAGMKGQSVDGLLTDEVCRKGLVIKGSFGLAPVSTMRAISLIESGRYPLEAMHSHTFALEDAEHAIRIVGGEMPGDVAVHVTVVP